MSEERTIMERLARAFPAEVVQQKPGRGGSKSALHRSRIQASVKATKTQQSRETALPRFLARIVQVPSPLDTPCWEWRGKRSAAGYGVFKTFGKNTYTHVFAYKHYVGPIPDGLRLDHLCRNRACANPAHLEPKTDRDNILCGEGVAARNARKTHCAHGHEFTEANTLVSGGRRYCRACRTSGARRERGTA